MRKFLGFIGLIGALFAAEGLNRLSTFVGAFRGADAPFYTGMLLISVVAAGVLLVSLFQRVVGWLKWLTALALIGSAVLMGSAPSLPVTEQVLGGIVVALVGVFAVSTAKKVVADPSGVTPTAVSKG